MRNYLVVCNNDFKICLFESLKWASISTPGDFPADVKTQTNRIGVPANKPLRLYRPICNAAQIHKPAANFGARFAI